MPSISDAQVYDLAAKKGKKGEKPDPKKPKIDMNTWGGPLTRAPDYLTGYAKFVFNQVISILPPDRLRRADKWTVVAYAVSVALHREAFEDVQKYGFTLLDDRGVQKANPANVVLKQQADLMKTLAAEIGLSPRARGSMKLDTGEGHGDWADDD